MMTTRRPRGRVDSDRAARRPRPNVERPAEPPLLPNVLPRWPAFFAARVTSPTKVFGRLAPWLPWRMRPGRTCRSSSRVVTAARASGNGGDGAWIIEIVDLYGKSASRRGSPMCRKIQPNQPLAPDRRRRFYLAVRWSGSWAPTFRHSKARHSPPACDQARPASWLPISMRNADKQARRLRREPVQSCAGPSVDRWPECGSDDADEFGRGALGRHHEQRRFGPRTHDRIDNRRVVDRPATDHWSEGGHVSLCLRRQRATRREMVLIAGWPGIVGSQKARGA